MNDMTLPLPGPAASARAIRLIGVASGAGANDARCALAPYALRARHLGACLSRRGLRARWTRLIRPPHCGSNVNAVRDVCARLENAVHSAVANGALPVVIGGDHTCAI